MLDIEISETFFIEKKTLNEKISGIVLSMWKVIKKSLACSIQLLMNRKEKNMFSETYIYSNTEPNVQQFIMHSACEHSTVNQIPGFALWICFMVKV